jgi:hypothetical protein
MLRWFDVKEIDALADSVVADLVERMPAGQLGAAEPKRARRARKAFGGLFARVDAYFRANRANVYQRARFANRIRWGLSEAGYPKALAEEITREIAMHAAVLSPARERRAD